MALAVTLHREGSDADDRIPIAANIAATRPQLVPSEVAGATTGAYRAIGFTVTSRVSGDRRSPATARR